DPRMQHPEGGGRRHVSNIQKVAVGAVGDVEKAGSGLDTLGWEHDLAAGGGRGIVGELDHIGTRTATAAGEVGGGYHSGGPVGREVDAGGEAGVDLPQSTIAVAVEQVHAGVEFVIERFIVHVSPVRGLRLQLRLGEVLYDSWGRGA